ncbi:uncharacterized protein LOC142210215 [Leptodactylus fuscus]|uniref:uncharacterized protein LOC142210215 n=1 Tax=Leptodactylus fuscus TaxID=238119 RepID=UPI003F4EACEA
MNNLLVCTVFVISLWSTGLGLACVQCTNPTASSCHGELRNCSGDDLCVSTVTETTAANGQKTFTFDRACGDAAQCNVTGSMTSFISAITHTTCCDTDSCTPRPPTLSKEKGEENAIRCPACLAHSRAQCSSLKVSKNCTGDEKFCAVYEVKSDTAPVRYISLQSEPSLWAAPASRSAVQLTVRNSSKERSQRWWQDVSEIRATV